MRPRLSLIFALSAGALIAAILAYWAWPYEPLAPGAAADLVIVNKSQRTLVLVRDGEVLRSFRIALGRNPQGHKVQEGDTRTSEGRYQIDRRIAASGFYRALHISYPNAADRERARHNHVSPGGDIMVHGIKNGLGWLGRLHRFVDWTNGCIAVPMRRCVISGTPLRTIPRSTSVRSRSTRPRDEAVRLIRAG
jgi:hypothetical protein